MHVVKVNEQNSSARQKKMAILKGNRHFTLKTKFQIRPGMNKHVSTSSLELLIEVQFFLH